MQNFRAKAGHADGARTGADARASSCGRSRSRACCSASTMSIQAPPNLRAASARGAGGSGINDWGGVSPVTPDLVNPEAPWPHLDDLGDARRVPPDASWSNGSRSRPRMRCAAGRLGRCGAARPHRACCTRRRARLCARGRLARRCALVSPPAAAAHWSGGTGRRARTRCTGRSPRSATAPGSTSRRSPRCSRARGDDLAAVLDGCRRASPRDGRRSA